MCVLYNPAVVLISVGANTVTLTEKVKFQVFAFREVKEEFIVITCIFLLF